MIIAHAKSKTSVKWKNKECTFDELIAFMSTVHVSKDKDCGGIISGYLRSGCTRRRSVDIEGAWVIVLDADSASTDFVDKVEATPYSYIIYSTRSHTAENPRYRLLFPLDKEVDPADYRHIICRIAQDLDVKNFCGCSYKTTQVMFFASRASEQDPAPFYKSRIAQPINTTEILKREVDWDLFGKTVTAFNGKKCADPRDTDSLAGAFCRKYSVTGTLEQFLAEFYEPTDDPTRWHYIEGTTPGLIIYDDLLAYSHHAEHDAAADGHCHSAFGLMCIHLHHGDVKAAYTWIRETLPDVVIEDATMAFEEIVLDIEETGFSRKMLDLNESGRPYSNLTNALRMIPVSTVLQGIWYNELAQKMVNIKPLPWRKTLDCWQDDDEKELRNYFTRNWGVTFKYIDVQGALAAIWSNRRFNPLTERLNSLVWDKQLRVERLFIDHLSVPDTALNRLMTLKWVAGCIQRAYNPGIKLDSMLILCGPPNTGKSKIFERLGMGFFTEAVTISDMCDYKKAVEKIQGYWLAEIKELHGMKKADQESLKSFLSMTLDRCRLPYERHAKDFKRLTVFAGTTNHEDILTDESGNRRYWILPTGEDHDVFTFDVDQIWAEARETLMEEPLYLTKTEETEAEKLREQFFEIDPWEAEIKEFIQILIPCDWYDKPVADRRGLKTFIGGTIKRHTISVQEIWVECFDKKLSEITQSDSRRIGKILRRLLKKDSLQYLVKGYGRIRSYRVD